MRYRHPIPGAIAVLLLGLAACTDPATAPHRSTAPALASVGTAANCDGAVFGPTDFTRTTGAPEVVATTFSATPGAFYRLEATELGIRGGVAEVRLNDAVVLRSDDLAGASRGAAALPVTLAASNRLEVRQAGRPGSRLELAIVDARPAALVRIAPTVSFVEVGRTRVYAAEVLDAEGRPIARCVTWSTADPAIATVESDGTVRGVTAGTTDLIARVDAVEARLPITVIERTGPTQASGYLGYCVVRPTDAGAPRACFDAVIRTTPLVSDQTLVELSLRNRQGSIGAETLPGTSMRSVFVLGTTTDGPFPAFQLGVSVTTQGNVEMVGSPAQPVITTGTLSFPPRPGGPEFDGTFVGSLAVLGCATYGTSTPSAFWRTCGDRAGTVDASFIVAGTWSASALALSVSFDAAPETFVGGSLDCTTRSVPANVCQQRLPALAP